MKKKKLISVMSSILFSFAFVGLFAVGLFLDYKQVNIETKAEGENILFNGNGNFVSNDYYYSKHVNTYTYDYDIKLNFDYSYTYSQVLEEGIQKTQFNIVFSLSFDINLVTDNQGYTGETFVNVQAKNGNNVSYSLSSQTYTNYLSHLDFYFRGFNPYEIEFSPNGLLYTRFFNDSIRENATILTNINLMSYSYEALVNTFDYNSFSLKVVDDDFVYDYSDYTNGLATGYNVGYQEGYTAGNNAGYTQGVEAGIQQQISASQSLIESAYNQGYAEGYSQGGSQDDAVNSIFGGISTVALIPVRFFLSIFNFEILGINVSYVVKALLSICLIIVVWRIVMGGKSND